MVFSKVVSVLAAYSVRVFRPSGLNSTIILDKQHSVLVTLNVSNHFQVLCEVSSSSLPQELSPDTGGSSGRSLASEDSRLFRFSSSS
jgi:hypothetical protein